MSRWLSILLTIPCLASAATEDGGFQQALTAFQNKNFQEARNLFEQAAAAHPHEASILHNWALTEVELGHKGLAVALWRKALSIQPGFSAAIKGRDYLEARYQMRGYEKDPWLRSVNRRIDEFSLDQLLSVIAILLVAGGWLWIRYLKDRKAAYEEAKPSPRFPTIATIFSVALLIAVTLFGFKVSLQLTARATTIADNVPAKSLPGEQGASLYELREGSEVLVRRSQQDWLQVTNSDGLTGWVKNTQVMITQGW